MKKILYLMHIPWRWVKQRPQYLAEHLSGFFEVDVFFRKLYCIENQLTNDQPTIRTHEITVLPLERFHTVWKLNCLIFGEQLRRSIHRFDLVWITNPLMYDMVEDVLPPGMKVVYDCMDDALEFPRIKKNVRLLERLSVSERQLVARSDMVYFSSATLKGRIVGRYGSPKYVQVLPNAILLEHDSAVPVPDGKIAAAFQAARCRLTYIGTISEWFDFSLVLSVLEGCTDVSVFLFGPSEVPIPVHDRLIHFGPVEHRQVFRLMEMSDALLMPFTINELVLAVDPVKLYEYIYSGKPVITVDYPETRKFSDYVYSYTTPDELQSLVTAVAARQLAPKAALTDCRRFAKCNTWTERAGLVAAQLDGLFGR